MFIIYTFCFYYVISPDTLSVVINHLYVHIIIDTSLYLDYMIPDIFRSEFQMFII